MNWRSILYAIQQAFEPYFGADWHAPRPTRRLLTALPAGTDPAGLGSGLADVARCLRHLRATVLTEFDRLEAESKAALTLLWARVGELREARPRAAGEPTSADRAAWSATSDTIVSAIDRELADLDDVRS